MSPNARKFVITGGAGFIGSHLAEALSKENEVLVIDDLSEGDLENLSGLDVEFQEGSIVDFAGNPSRAQDCVFHQTAIASVKKSVEDPLRTNVVGNDGTLKVLPASLETQAIDM